MCRCSLNRFFTGQPEWVLPEYEAFFSGDVLSFHQSVPGYSPTPLLSLPALAATLGVREIFVKDESHRFGLKAFKSMGASYATYRFIKRAWEKRFGVEFQREYLYQPDVLAELQLPPLCTATDGNHGRAVAWFARLIGQTAVIYMPTGTVKARIENIEREGAKVVVVDGDYDCAVRQVARDAEKNGWQIISDTSYTGYTQIPAWIMAGYTTMFAEIDRTPPISEGRELTHVILQTGVGSFAGAAAWYYRGRPSVPGLISVEPTAADCFLQSVLLGDSGPVSSHGDATTIMAGLNCATPSLLAWPLVRDSFSMFVAISDDFSRRAMRQYYYPCGSDPQIVSGESGAAGLGGLMALMQDERFEQARTAVRLNAQSRVLLFNTEGDTDPENFERVISAGPLV